MEQNILINQLNIYELQNTLFSIFGFLNLLTLCLRILIFNTKSNPQHEPYKQNTYLIIYLTLNIKS